MVDAGIGLPSHVAQVMELGFDGVLLNTSIARCDDPAKDGKSNAPRVDCGKIGVLYRARFQNAKPLSLRRRSSAHRSGSPRRIDRANWLVWVTQKEVAYFLSRQAIDQLIFVRKLAGLMFGIHEFPVNGDIKNPATTRNNLYSCIKLLLKLSS